MNKFRISFSFKLESNNNSSSSSVSLNAISYSSHFSRRCEKPNQFCMSLLQNENSTQDFQEELKSGECNGKVCMLSKRTQSKPLNNWRMGSRSSSTSNSKSNNNERHCAAGNDVHTTQWLQFYPYVIGNEEWIDHHVCGWVRFRRRSPEWIAIFISSSFK